MHLQNCPREKKVSKEISVTSTFLEKLRQKHAQEVK